jgi:hypothetical protein
LIEELKMRLQKTEEASEQYHRQIQTLQSRLDDSLIEQGKLEERLHEEEERVEGLENEKRESISQKRELERIYEAERAQMMKDKEDTRMREEEMQAVIQRLKESLTQRESRPGLSDDGRLSRTCKYYATNESHNELLTYSSSQLSLSRTRSIRSSFPPAQQFN